jgi:predicted kinase
MKLIVFSGLPGTGKSALAEGVARELGIPVFAKDWLEATLLRCELVPFNKEKPLGSAGYQLLTTLAERQLMLGQSVILDSVASTESIRSSWKQLAAKYEADWLVIECICLDENIQRARLKRRQRHIPSWHELDWAGVEAVKSYFAPWDEARLVVDAIVPVGENLKTILDWLKSKKEIP